MDNINQSNNKNNRAQQNSRGLTPKPNKKSESVIQQSSVLKGRSPSNQQQRNKNNSQHVQSSINYSSQNAQRNPSASKYNHNQSVNSNQYSSNNNIRSSSTNNKHFQSVNDYGAQPEVSSQQLIHLSNLASNPLTERQFISQQTSQNAIFVQWSHPSYQSNTIQYVLEYGIGMKQGGKELFRQVYKGSEPSYKLQNLQPKTSYRIRVKAILLNEKSLDIVQTQDSEKIKESQEGEWSEIISVTTSDIQSLDQESLGNHAIVQKQNNQNLIIVFDNPGTIYGSQPLYFGIYKYQVKVLVSQHNASEDNACVMIGVSSRNKDKENIMKKKNQIVGSIINYGLNKESYIVDIIVDLDKQQMIIKSPINKKGEIFNTLPSYPLYPAIQNKSKMKQRQSLKIDILFQQDEQD